MNYIKALFKYVLGIKEKSISLAYLIIFEKLIRLLLYPVKFFNKGFNINFYVLGFNYILNSSTGVFYIRAHTDDEFIVSPMFEPEMQQYFTLSGGIFLDIGSHIGKYSVAIGNQNSKNKVIAFEANTQTYDSVKINLILNNITNAVVENVAVGENKGELIFLESKKNTGISRLVTDNGHSLIKEGAVLNKDIQLKSIQTISIDEYLSENNLDITEVKLIKIDTEGNEYSVLKGMKKLLELNKSIQLIVEITDNLNNILEFMSQYGYKHKKISSTYFIFNHK